MPVQRDISIHAPHARSDARRDGSIVHDLYFNPRSSCEERPHDDIDFANRADFNPRSSCEERPSGGTRSTTHFQFQSTLLMRGATDHVDPEDKALLFQSTLLMRGATCRWDSARHPNDYFNPRSSCEERLCYFQALICLTSSYIFREPLTSFRKHFF